MLNQEEYVRLHELKNEGWTNREIAEELGYHPATVAKWLNQGGPPGPVIAHRRHTGAVPCRRTDAFVA